MKLTDTQSLILSAASQHSAYIVLPLPKNLRGGAAQKVVASLIKAGLVEEVPVQKGEEIWNLDRRTTLVITAAGLDAIGVEAPASDRVKAEPKKGKAKAVKASAPAEGATPRGGTKQAQMIELLRRKAGATVDEIVEATGWQRHTVRGAMAGALKKRLGLSIEATAEARGRVYRIA